VGKSFEYWKHLYDQGIIDHHVIHLRLNHLKYILDHNLITNKEYYEHRIDITDQYTPSYTDYKPYSLMSFGKALSTHNLMDNLERNKHSEDLNCKVQKSIINISGDINQQNYAIVDVQDYYLNAEQENNNKTEMPIKSRKKRKRKKKFNDSKNIYHTNTLKTVITEPFKDEWDENMKNSIVKSKNSVKIFNRQMNNKVKSHINRKESLVSTQRSLRNILSKMLKQFKNERQLQC